MALSIYHDYYPFARERGTNGNGGNFREYLLILIITLN
jgi:hypothetical protein